MQAGVYSGKNSMRMITMKGIRTKRVRTVKEGTLLAKVDIGMASNTGYCITADSRDTKPFKFGNTRESQRLHRFLIHQCAAVTSLLKL